MNWLAKLLPSGSVLSDEQAMRAVKERCDQAAFAQLVDCWQAPIRRLCTRLTDDEHRGEDLAQETFARVFANRHQFEDGRKFSTWLWRIALNLCHENARRARRRDESPPTELGSIASPGPDEVLIGQERVDLVRSALANLPESHRVVVVLREYQGLKFREIAEVLGMPEGTVKSQMADALTQLERQLKPLIEVERPRPALNTM